MRERHPFRIPDLAGAQELAALRSSVNSHASLIPIGDRQHRRVLERYYEFLLASYILLNDKSTAQQ